ncbi:MAG TPA: DivIVA domain-containing protein, partial [Actinomycetota bacterium]
MDRDDATGGRGSEWSVKPSRRITPEEVQAKEFGTARVRVGYLMHEVDEFLDQITDTLSALTA